MLPTFGDLCSAFQKSQGIPQIAPLGATPADILVVNIAGRFLVVLVLLNFLVPFCCEIAANYSTLLIEFILIGVLLIFSSLLVFRL